MAIFSCREELVIPYNPENKDEEMNTFFSVNNTLQSNMVIQQNRHFTISGAYVSGQTVHVNCSWDGMVNNYTKVVSEDGKWSVLIDVPKGSFDVHSITVEANKNKKVFYNILIGEVWLCSGQSNMVYNVKNLLNRSEEIENADYAYIRLLTMNRITSSEPVETFKSKWQVCTQSTIPDFSAVAYFFGRKLFEDLQVPIGLINSSWGATPIEMWCERNSLLNDDKTREHALTKELKHRIGSSYNTMIYPLKDVPIAGVIWYQGEANIQHPYFYPFLLSNMVASWRALWKNNSPEFPFYISQICPYNRIQEMPTYFANPALRFMQAASVDLIHNSGIESNDDIADIYDIHPKNKKDVGLRLAWLALNKTYGKKEYSDKLTPLYKRFETHNNKLRIVFKHAGKGLRTRDNAAPRMFEIAGSDRVFHNANATVLNDSIVEIFSDKVIVPVAARLGWSYTRITNLMSGDNLPVSVFRTYNWDDLVEEPE